MLVDASQEGHLTIKQQLPMSHFCETLQTIRLGEHRSSLSWFGWYVWDLDMNSLEREMLKDQGQEGLRNSHVYCAKSLQSCLTLCDPMDYSPPGSSVCGNSPSKNTGVGYHALLQGIFLTQGLNQCLLFRLY